MLIAGLSVLLLLSVGGVITARHIYNENLKPVNANQKRVIVTIPSGSSVKEVAKILKNSGVIKSEWAFERYIRNRGLDGSVKAGTYALQASQSVQEIVDTITEGNIKTDLVTIVPGLRIDQIKKVFIKDGFNAADVDAALSVNLYRNHPALTDLPSSVNSLEGYLYPESFQKTAETTPKDIVSQSLDQMQKYLTPEVRNSFVAQGLTVHQGIILASILEQEVSSTSDRTQAAQVFLKRLRLGVPLGSDVTVIYGAIVAGQPPSLTYDSPYNTHLHTGLPSGPISSVSESSMQAVAHPANTDWLYFVSGDDGVTYFSRTLEEHNALTAQHCKQLCAPNGN